MAIGLSVVGGCLVGLVVHAFPRLRRILDPLFTGVLLDPDLRSLSPADRDVRHRAGCRLIVMGALFGIVAMVVATLYRA